MRTDIKELQRIIDRLEDENLQLKNLNNHLEGKILDLEEEKAKLTENGDYLIAEKISLEDDIMELEIEKLKCTNKKR